MRRTRILTVACLVVCVLALRAFGGDDAPSAPQSSPLTDADRGFFQWWDDLGYPELSKLPFGEVWLGHWIRRGSDPPVQRASFGWRVRESTTSIDVLTLELRSRSLQKREIEGEPWNRRGFDAIDLLEKAPAWAASHGPPASWRKAVLARACAGQGRDDLAKRLLDAAQADGPEHPAPTSARLPDRYAWVREQIGKSALDALARSLPDDRRPWSEVQVDWERAADHFASDANRADLESGRVALKSMVADEVATAEHPPKSWKDLAEAERAPWLVHEMQEATDLIRDGKVSWWDSTDADPPAHHRLVELGFAAVPALLAALDDARLTRMVDSREPSRTRRVHNRLDVTDVLRVGDLAWQTLDRISGGVLATDAERVAPTWGRGARGARAAAWYARVGALGEARALADAIRGGSWHALEMAERLARLDPVLAVSALEAGAVASEDSASFLAVMRLAEISGEAATEALVRLLPRLSDPASRIQAATAAFARGRREGLDDLVKTWSEGLAEMHRSPAPGASARRSTWDLALDALAKTRDPTALQALAAGLAGEPPLVRSAVVARFVPTGRRMSESVDELGPTGGKVTDPPSEAPFPEMALPVLESLLADRLEDGDRTEGLWVTLDVPRRDPVIGEIAAYALSKRFPARWTFDVTAPALERADARVALANRWRAAHGKPPIHPPAARAAPSPIPYDVLRSDLERASAPDFSVRKAALEAIEARGLPAFPAVLQAFRSLEAGAPGRSGLEDLARRLSFVVVEAVLTDDSAPADDGFRAALAASVGKSFSGSLYTAFLRLGTTERPPGTFGLRVVAERLDAGRGVSIRVTLLPEPRKRYQVGTWGLHWQEPVIHRRPPTGFTKGGSWSASEAFRGGELGAWTVRINFEIEASELDDDFLVDGHVAFER